VKVRTGFGVPLVRCNGIGASLEVLDPLVAHLARDTTVVRFDVPGTGGSPGSPVPYGFPYLAAVMGRLLRRLGLHGPVDVLGIMAALLPHATLHLHPGGHTDLITHAADLAPVIEAFRGRDRPLQR